MYAEVRVFEDDGRPMMDRPYYVPATDIHASRTEMSDSGTYDVLHYVFKFTMTKAVPRNPNMADIYDRESRAYHMGFEDGKRSNYKWVGDEDCGSKDGRGE